MNTQKNAEKIRKTVVAARRRLCGEGDLVRSRHVARVDGAGADFRAGKNVVVSIRFGEFLPHSLRGRHGIFRIVRRCHLLLSAFHGLHGAAYPPLKQGVFHTALETRRVYIL